MFLQAGNQLLYSNKIHTSNIRYKEYWLIFFLLSLLYSRNSALIQGLTTGQAMQLAYFVNNKNTGNKNMGYDLIGLHVYTVCTYNVDEKVSS